MITVIAHFTIATGQRAAVLSAADKMTGGIQSTEPGTLLYLTSTRVDGDGAEYLDTVEVYRDKSALDAHLRKGGPWDSFSQQAAERGWLKTQPDDPSALDMTFTSGELCGALLNLNRTFDPECG